MKIYNQDEKFLKHLDHATATVNSWPDWKKNLLGWITDEEFRYRTTSQKGLAGRARITPDSK